MTHKLKTWPRYFSAVLDGSKTFEMRINDREYKIGDFLHLVEWSEGGGYTGRELFKVVTYIADQSAAKELRIHWGTGTLPPVVMSIRDLTAPEIEAYHTNGGKRDG